MPSKSTIITTLSAGMWVLLMAGLAPAAKADSHERDSESTYAYSDPEDEGWRYDTYYIFPLTRHMPDSELSLGVQIALYPLAFAIDLGQWPFGAIAGLGGE